MLTFSPFGMKSVPKLSHLCLGCSKAIEVPTTGRTPKSCGESCKKRVQRARVRLTPVVRFLARLVVGAPLPRTPLAGLLRAMWRLETVRARAELQAARLPGSGG